MSSYSLESSDAIVDGVRISTIHLESVSSARVKELSGSLDVVEQARAARFRFEGDRRDYIAAHGLLRRLLGDALDEPASAIAFQYGARGKPMISNPRLPTLHFNLSHSEGWAMFALAWNREVGIDLEAAARFGDEQKLRELAARVLSPREVEIWRSLPDAPQRRTALLRAWTRKEAYGKATGEGLFDGLQEIELALDAASPKASLMVCPFQRDQNAMRAWTIHELSAPEGLGAALVVEQK